MMNGIVRQTSVEQSDLLSYWRGPDRFLLSLAHFTPVELQPLSLGLSRCKSQ